MLLAVLGSFVCCGRRDSSAEPPIGEARANRFALSADGVLFLDEFDRTTGLGSAWTVPFGAFSTDGTARGTQSSSYAFWIGQPDASSTVSVTLPRPSDTYAGVLARANPATPDRDHYAAYLGPDGRVAIARRDAYVYTYLGTGPVAAAGSHTLALNATGAGPVTISVSLDGNAGGTPADAGARLDGGGSVAVDAGGPGAGATLFFDDFNRTGSLGATWRVGAGAFSADGASAVGSLPSSYAFWIGQPPADATVSLKVRSPTANT
jgi:hypothetical protein